MVDAIIILMLLSGFGYAFNLSRKFDKLHRALKEIGPALSAFSEAVDRSEQSVNSMKRVSADMGRSVTRPRSDERAPTGREGMIKGFFARAKEKTPR